MASKLPLRASRLTLTPCTRPAPLCTLPNDSHPYSSAHANKPPAKDAIKKAESPEERAVLAAKRAQWMAHPMNMSKATQIKLKSERRKARRNVAAQQEAAAQQRLTERERAAQEGALQLAAREMWIARLKKGNGKDKSSRRESDERKEREREQRLAKPGNNKEKAEAARRLEELRKSVQAITEYNDTAAQSTVLNIAKQPLDLWGARVEEALVLAGNGPTPILRQKPPEKPRTTKKQSLEFTVAEETELQDRQAAKPDSKRKRSWEDLERARAQSKRPDARQMREDERAAKVTQARDATRPQDTRPPPPYAKQEGARDHFPRATKPDAQAANSWEDLERASGEGLKKASVKPRQPWQWRGGKDRREKDRIKALERQEMLRMRKGNLGKADLGKASF